MKVYVVMVGEQTASSGCFSSLAKAKKWLSENSYRSDGGIYYLIGEDKDEPVNCAWINEELVQ